MEFAHGKPQFGCGGSGCGLEFYTSAELTSHQQNNCPHLHPALCSQCGKTFKEEESLRSHLQNEHKMSESYQKLASPDKDGGPERGLAHLPYVEA